MPDGLAGGHGREAIMPESRGYRPLNHLFISRFFFVLRVMPHCVPEARRRVVALLSTTATLDVATSARDWLEWLAQSVTQVLHRAIPICAAFSVVRKCVRVLVV